MIIYVIDTSALVDIARWYPMDRDFFKPIWEKVDKLISSGYLVAPYEVYREINARTDELAEWAKHRRQMFIHPNKNQILFLPRIRSAYDKTYWEAQANKTGPWADPWLISLALHFKNNPLTNDDVKIVTDESKFKPNRIPTVASRFGIESLKLLEFFWEIGIR